MTNEKPDSFDKHEVMDRASIAQRILNDMLDGHPAMTPTLNALLETASDAIGELYQEAGANCFDDANARDAEMLDWLEKVEYRFYNIDRITAIVGVGFNGLPTLREAIRAAMAQQPKEST